MSREPGSRGELCGGAEFVGARSDESAAAEESRWRGAGAGILQYRGCADEYRERDDRISELTGMYKLIVFGMCPDPNPGYRIGFQLAECTIVLANANRETIVATLQAAEPERRVVWILKPESINFDRESLNVSRQTVKQPPEPSRKRRISLIGRPVAEHRARGFVARFVKNEIELARLAIGVHLVVPGCVVSLPEPACEATELFRGQLVDCGFDFFDAIHIWSLTHRWS